MLSPNPTTVTIASGGSASSEVNLGGETARRNLVIGIAAPETLPETIHIDVSTVTGGTFVRLQSPPGTDIQIAADKAIILTDFPFQFVKLVTASGTVAADRTFQVTANSKN